MVVNSKILILVFCLLSRVNELVEIQDNSILFIHHLQDYSLSCTVSVTKTGPANCAEAKCSHGCQVTKSGPICSCRRGYFLMNDSRTCKGKNARVFQDSLGAIFSHKDNRLPLFMMK